MINIVVLNGAGTKGNELNILIRSLKKNERYIIHKINEFPGQIISNKFNSIAIKKMIQYEKMLVDMIKPLENVILIGYSYGALTIFNILNHLSNVIKTVLITPLFKHPSYIKFIWRMRNITSQDKIHKMSAIEILRRIRMIPVISIISISKYLRRAKKHLKTLAPHYFLIIESTDDEVLSSQNYQALYKSLKKHHFETLFVDAGHFVMYYPSQRKKITNHIEQYIERKY
jgi:homoserine acetyltransferase